MSSDQATHFNTSKAAVSLTLSTVVLMAINALTGVFVARSLGAQPYGEVAYYMSMYLLATLIGGFGLTSQVMRDVGEAYERRSQEGVSRSFYTLLTARLVSGLVLVGVTAVVAAVQSNPTMLLVGVGAALSMLSDFLGGLLRGVQRIGRLILLLWFQPAIYLALLATQPMSTAAQVILAFSISMAASVALGFLLLLGTPLGRPRSGSLSSAYVRASSGLALQIYSIGLLQTFYGSIGTFVLGYAHLYHETGLISVALTIARMPPLVLGPAIGSVLYPQMCAKLSAGALGMASAAFDMFRKVCLLVAGSALVLLLVFPDTALATLYTESYLDAAPALRLLAPTSLMLVADLLITWVLVAHQAIRPVLFSLVVRLALIVLGSIAAVFYQQDAALVVSGAYTISALAGLALQISALYKATRYHLQVFRTVVAMIVALATAIACRAGIPDLHLGVISYLGNAVVAAVSCSVIYGVFLFRPELRAAVARVVAAPLSRTP